MVRAGGGSGGNRDGLCEALGEHFFPKHAPDDLTIVLVGVHRAYPGVTILNQKNEKDGQGKMA